MLPMNQIGTMVLSMAAEATVAYALAKFLTVTSWRAAVTAALATAMSHPLAWFSALALYPRMQFWHVAIILKALIVLAEAPLYLLLAGTTIKASVALSLLANMVSFTVG